MKQGFKTFADQKIDYGVIATKTPIPNGEAMIDTRGALLLCGYFDITPSRVNYELDFVPSEGEWKPLKLNIDIKRPQS